MYNNYAIRNLTYAQKKNTLRESTQISSQNRIIFQNSLQKKDTSAYRKIYRNENVRIIPRVFSSYILEI